MTELKDKVAVVTGGASGIGLALAERFAHERMRVVIADIEESALAAAVDRLRKMEAEVFGFSCDVSKPAAVAALADETYSRFGAAHILCNNAGVGGSAAPVWAQTPDNWKWVLGVNLMGVIHGIQSFVPRMLAGGEEGHVVNTASAAGLISGPFLSPYYAAKHAVVAISEALDIELQIVKSRIGVSALCPGFVRTRIADSNRNRPEGDFGPPGAPEMAEKMRVLIEGGMAPEAVADQVLDAIRGNRFWIVTHAEIDGWVRDKADQIIERRNPELRLPGELKNATTR